MKSLKRNIALTIIWCGFTVPFILQTDFYPFLRFGMFAEPVRHKIQEEQFFLNFYDKEGNLLKYNTQQFGLYKSKLDYLLRNHYYRNEPDVFLHKLKPSLFYIPGLAKADFMKSINSDTIVVATINLNE